MTAYDFYNNLSGQWIIRIVELLILSDMISSICNKDSLINTMTSDTGKFMKPFAKVLCGWDVLPVEQNCIDNIGL